MGLRKGQTNNPHGRPAGGKNNRTKQWEMLGDFLTKEGAERAMTVLDNLDDETFLDQYYKLLAYFKPKQVHNINEQKDPVKIVFENVSDKVK